MVAVGGAAIDAAPTWLKEFAIRNFGTNDKQVLLSGILIVLAILTMIIGIAAAWRFAVGVALIVLLGAVAILAELGRPTATASYPIPTLIGLAVALGLLHLLLRLRPRQQSLDAAAGSEQPSLVTGSRRQFLLTGAGVGASAAAALATGNLISTSKATTAARAAVRLPQPADAAPPLPSGVDLKIAGLPPFVTPNAQFYRVDTAIVTPKVNPNSWRLKVGGMVASPIALSYQDLLALPMIERDITLACVSNEVGGPYISSARWLGVPLKVLMDRLGLDPAANQLFSTSTDGFSTSTPTKLALDGRDAMIAVGMNGQPLPITHGFPARMVVPGLYGYVSGCKWLSSITATTYAAKKAYWTQRGWDINGPIYTESRIDVPADRARIRAGTVAIAGIAWAQHRGIRMVEVSVDGGPWQAATLADTPGPDTWRQWSIRWDAPAGEHQIRARATDGTGAAQTQARQDVFPRGATGYPGITVSVS